MGVFKCHPCRRKRFCQADRKERYHGSRYNERPEGHGIHCFKGANPRIAVDYTTVNRNRAWPIELFKGGNIEQNGKIIGQFVPRGSMNGMDYYDFTLPSGVIVAKIGFTGENFAQKWRFSQQRIT